MRFMLTEGNLNNGVYVEFFKRLLGGARHPVSLVVMAIPSTGPVR